VVTTLAGRAGVSGTNDGTGSAALFYYPNGLAVDSAGNVFVADSGNNTIRKVTSTGVVTTIGGVAGVMSGADGIGSYAIFAEPCGVAVDSAGTVYVADRNNNRISKGTPIYPLLTAGFDGRHVQLSWPTIYLGWELQAQTNLPGAGLSTNWSSVASSTNNAQMSIPIDPACPSVFYRLHQQ
jgi:secreted PhoX family phosphatase